MSRGPGQVQRFVLVVLRFADEPLGVSELASLWASYKRDGVRPHLDADWREWAAWSEHVRYTPSRTSASQYESVRRAVGNLRRRGLVAMDGTRGIVRTAAAKHVI